MTVSMTVSMTMALTVPSLISPTNIASFHEGLFVQGHEASGEGLQEHDLLPALPHLLLVRRAPAHRLHLQPANAALHALQRTALHHQLLHQLLQNHLRGDEARQQLVVLAADRQQRLRTLLLRMFRTTTCRYRSQSISSTSLPFAPPPAAIVLASRYSSARRRLRCDAYGQRSPSRPPSRCAEAVPAPRATPRAGSCSSEWSSPTADRHGHRPPPTASARRCGCTGSGCGWAR